MSSYSDNTPVYPWIEDPSATADSLLDAFKCRQVVLGYWDNESDTAHTGLICTAGLTIASVQKWFKAGILSVPVIQQTRLQLSDVSEESQGPFKHNVLAAGVPATHTTGHYWTLILARDQLWTRQEQRAAEAWIRLYRAAFDRPSQSGVHRLLIDDELNAVQIDATLALDKSLPTDTLMQGLQSLIPILIQRYGQPIPAQPVAMTVPFPNEPARLRLIPTQSPGPQATSAFLEIRPADPDGPPALGLLKDPRVARCVAYVCDHYTHNPSLGHLAEVADLSAFHIHRLFTQTLGISPKQYALRLQIQHAKHLLIHTKDPIADIAQHAGFASHGHFTATFRRITGMKPSDAR